METDILKRKTEIRSEKEIVYGIYFNKSRKFSLKFAAVSLVYSFSSIGHFILNAFQKKFSGNHKIVFLSNANEFILNELKDSLGGLELVKQNVYEKKSFLQRMNSDSKIHYNNIISAPFFRICPDENAFYRAVALNFIRNYERFLEKNKSLKKIILYDEYSLPSWTFTAAAKNNSRKTIAIQHANIPKEHKEYKDFIIAATSYLPESIITFSEDEKKNLEKMIQSGKTKERTEKSEKRKEFTNTKVVALGCSRFDILNEKYDKETVKRKLNITAKNTVVWMTQTHSLSTAENEENCRQVFETFKILKDTQLIIKLHPGEVQKNTIYDKYNNRYGHIAKILRGKDNTYDLIRASDAILLKDSSTFMIASLLGKEIGILNLVENRQYYKEYDFPIIIKNDSEIISFIKGVGTNKHKQIFNKFNKRITGKYFKNFGHATRKIVEYIKKN